MTITSKKSIWIELGYKLFSEMGKECLNVEFLSREIGKSKSSFYHYFGDLEIYIDELLEYHLQKVKANAEEIKNSKTLYPGVYNIYLEKKVDTFFHKNLRVHRDEEKFQPYIKQAADITENAMLDAWQTALNLDERPLFAKSYLNLISDNFFLRITPSTFNGKWLYDYMKEVFDLLSNVGKSEKKLEQIKKQ